MRNKGYTLIELLVVMITIGFLCLLTSLNVIKVAPDANKTKFKKAYSDIENIVSQMITNDVLYSGSDGLANTESVIVKGIGETIGLAGPTTKFRDAFKYYSTVVEDNLECAMFNSQSSKKCFKTDDGVVYGIPDTDFNNVGIKTIGSERYAPITLYTNFNKTHDPIKDAFYIGVSKTGKIKVITTVTCNDSHKEYCQCKALKFIQSGSIKQKDD